jgi:hypothetical protein
LRPAKEGARRGRTGPDGGDQRGPDGGARRGPDRGPDGVPDGGARWGPHGGRTGCPMGARRGPDGARRDGGWKDYLLLKEKLICSVYVSCKSSSASDVSDAGWM